MQGTCQDRRMPWVLDLDGVVWLGDEPIPGAAAAVAALRRVDDAVLFVTNNSSVPLAEVEAKLGRHGIDATGQVVSSALAAARLVQPGEVVLVCGGPGLVEALEQRGATVVREGPADVVMVGFHRDFTWDRMRIASTAIRGGARFVASNDDATYPTPEGLVPGGGAIVAGIATAAGVEPEVAGKPHQAMADLVRARLGPDGTVVGDRADTDGLFARRLGYRFALVLSGVTTTADLPVQPEPDEVAASLADLVDRLPAS
jgi:4-nitrophenyl phosphatase